MATLRDQKFTAADSALEADTCFEADTYFDICAEGERCTSTCALTTTTTVYTDVFIDPAVVSLHCQHRQTLCPEDYAGLSAFVHSADIKKRFENDTLLVYFNGSEIIFSDKVTGSTIVFAKSADDAELTEDGDKREEKTEKSSSTQRDKKAPKSGGAGSGNKDQDGSDRAPDRKGDPSTKRALLASAVNVARDLPKMEMGARELCCYYPNHSQWADKIIRLLRNDWKLLDIAKAQLYHRTELNHANLVRRHNALRHQILVAGRDRYSNTNWTPTTWRNAAHPETHPFSAAPAGGGFLDLYDVSGWVPKRGRVATGGYPTFAQIRVGVNVDREPRGEDRGVFTQTVQWVFANHGDDWRRVHTIDEIPAIAAAQGFEQPSEARNTATWDQNAVARLRAFVGNPIP